MTFATDVLVIGSGFGGSVAALRFAESGARVTVLERGPWVTRDTHEVDLDALWLPHRHRFGQNELRSRGRNVVPWLGAGVGGGSHVYAATLKRMESFAGFPAPIRDHGLAKYYARAEEMMGATPYPDYAPYSDVRATQLAYEVGAKLQESHPELVEDWGPIQLGISFAPPGATPGAPFVNKHGARQRYSDPQEQALLGGDIDSKNSLDKNYLFLAQRAGAEVRPLCQADRIEPLPNGGYRVHFTRYVPEKSAWRRFGRKWLGRFVKARDETDSITCQRLVLAAGAIGSTELLLRNRDVHKTLPNLSPRLGARYTSNGDFLSLMFPFRGIFVSWLGLAAVLWAWIFGPWWVAVPGALAYFGGLLLSRPSFDPDIGTTNSDYIRFRGEDGQPQGAYIEGGRYPTPLRFGIASLLSGLGIWRPHRYRHVIRATRFLRKFVPPFELIARSWPIPLLSMGRDHATGKFKLDDNGRATIDYELEKNLPFYDYVNRLGKLVAHTAKARWAPNVLFSILKKVEVPHNQGGAIMGESKDDGVVDHAGRVFGYDDLLVLDGSIIPRSPGPNPALTILALAERALEINVQQVAAEGRLRA